MNRLTLFGLLWLTIAAAGISCEAHARDAVVPWTAPGDDGNLGQASSYDLRYKTIPVAGTDTLGWWNNAAQAPVPIPSVAGAADSSIVAGLDPSRTYYFIIVAVDEAGNRSFFSNVAVLPSLDVARPGTIVLGIPRWR